MSFQSVIRDFKTKPFRAWILSIWHHWLEKAQMRDQLFTFGVAVVIGVLCGFGAVGFRYLIELVQLVFWGDHHVVPELLAKFPWWKVLLIPAAGGLVVGPVIYYFAREAQGHGVPEVMTAIALKDGVIRGRVAVVKAFTSAVTIGSGGSAGPEGPIIQIGSAIGSFVGQFLAVSKKKMRTFVACGAAAGLAATFNAPIAGALFAVEVVLGEFAMAHFSPIVISSVIATLVARHYWGDGSVFTVPGYELASVWEMGPYLLLGVLCGVVSIAFIRALYGAEDLFARLKRCPPYLKPALGGLLLGVVGLALPHVYGDGEHVINLALSGQLVWWLLALVLVAKIAATSFTLGSGGSGGVFAPSLFMGATLGGALGYGVGAVMGASAGHSGGYALVAMGGLVAGTTHAPITAILMIFEITSNYQIILPLMMVCIISIVISSRFSRESIYTLKLIRQGIDIFRGRSLDVLKSFPVADLVRSDYEMLEPDARIADAVDRLSGTDKAQFYLLSEDRLLKGVVLLKDLSRVLSRKEGLDQVLLAEDLAQEGVPVCYPDENLSQALVKLDRSGLAELPVVERETSRMIGVLHYADVLSVYNNEILKRDTAEVVASRMAVTETDQRVAVLPGLSIMEWDPPRSYVGKTLAECQLPSRFNVRVLLVKKKQSDLLDAELVPQPPGGDYAIEYGDTLLVYGRDEDLDKLA